MSIEHDPSRYVSDRFLSVRWGVHRTTPWQWAKSKPDFPKPVRLAERCTRWKLSEIKAWEAAQAEAAATKYPLRHFGSTEARP